MKKRVLSVLMAMIVTAIGFTPVTLAETPQVTINGNTVIYDSDSGYPFIDSANRTQVPLRRTMEQFGCTVTWNDSIKSALIVNGNSGVGVPIGMNFIVTDMGDKIYIDTSAQIVNGRTYMPIRVVVEALGGEVSWNEYRRSIDLYTPSYAYNGAEQWQIDNAFNNAINNITSQPLNLTIVETPVSWQSNATNMDIDGIVRRS